MDREQEEVQFLGFFGIFKESANIILSWRRIFTQITLSLIFPLTFITFTQIQISHIIFSKIKQNERTLDQTQLDSASYPRISNLISSEWAAYFAFKFSYFTALLVFSLLSTSAVVYTAVGLLYITVVWHLASGVSVLEDTYGINAMRKSRDLVKGKMGIACGVFVVIGICFSGIQFVFKGFVVSVVFGWLHSVWIWRWLQ